MGRSVELRPISIIFAPLYQPRVAFGQHVVSRESNAQCQMPRGLPFFPQASLIQRKACP